MGKLYLFTKVHVDACMALSCSGTYKEYLETTEHIERDLQTFRDVTKELTYHMNTVGFISGL